MSVHDAQKNYGKHHQPDGFPWNKSPQHFSWWNELSILGRLTSGAPKIQNQMNQHEGCGMVMRSMDEQSNNCTNSSEKKNAKGWMLRQSINLFFARWVLCGHVIQLLMIKVQQKSVTVTECEIGTQNDNHCLLYQNILSKGCTKPRFGAPSSTAWYFSKRFLWHSWRWPSSKWFFSVSLHWKTQHRGVTRMMSIECHGPWHSVRCCRW